MKQIVIFASGNGSNAQRIIEYFHSGNTIRVAAIYCNNPGGYVIERAKKLDVRLRLFTKNEFIQPGGVPDELKKREPDMIVLSGFLWLIPQQMIAAFPNRIINIHPALLPKFGGKGMYGSKVHEAVLASGDKESGISIHFVNEQFDQGEIIFQARCTIDKNETPESLARKIHELEYSYFPTVIENLLTH